MSTSVDMLVGLMCRTNVPMVDCCGLNNVGWTLLCGLITKILGILSALLPIQTEIGV